MADDDILLVQEEDEGRDRLVGSKNSAKNFAAVRARGMLNSGLDSLSERYESDNPGMKARWVRFVPSKETEGGIDDVINFESIGYKLVDASEMSGGTASSQRSGPIRRGDLVLMAAPESVHNMLRQQDAEVAAAELKASQSAYRESLKDNTRVTLADGETDQARPAGQIRISTEVVNPTDIASRREKGGE